MGQSTKRAESRCGLWSHSHRLWGLAGSRCASPRNLIREAWTSTRRPSVLAKCAVHQRQSRHCPFYPLAREEQCLPADPARSALARSLRATAFSAERARLRAAPGRRRLPAGAALTASGCARGDYYCRRLGAHLSLVADLGGWWDGTDFHETRDNDFCSPRLEELWRCATRSS